jgi:hypothetical protein
MDAYWVVLILLVVALVLILSRNYSGFSEEIPKIIWTYWDGADVPDTVKKCMDTWRKHNPDYKIIQLSNDNINQYIPEANILDMKMANTPQRKSDFIRIHVIEKYGGIWCDASIMMNGSLEFIRQKTGYDFVGYHIGKMMNTPNSPVPENWFIAAPPGSNFIKKWRETFVKINDFKNPEDYVKSIRDQGVDITKVESPEYLTMHVASQHVIQKQMTPDEVSNKLFLMKAEDGPFKYLQDNNWDSPKGIESMCGTKYPHPIVKFRGYERGLIESNGKLKCVFD